MVYIDGNHYYDLKWRVVSMSRIIAKVCTDQNHCYDLKWGVIIMPRIIAMISTEELKSLLWFKFQVKNWQNCLKGIEFSTAKNNNFILHLSK